MRMRGLCLTAWTLAVLVVTSQWCLNVVAETECESLATLQANQSLQELDYLNDPKSFNSSCWLITASDLHHSVRVNFTHIDYNGTCGEGNCTCDVIEVFDGQLSQSRKLGEICGLETSHLFDSSSEKVFIRFRPSVSSTLIYFQLTYQTVYRIEASFTQECRPDAQLIADSQEVRKLTFPMNSPYYPRNSDCLWILYTKSPLDYVVHVTFTFVDIQASDDCSLDYVELKGSYLTSSDSLGKLCGLQTNRDFYSLYGALVVHFHSGASQGGQGFQMLYKEVPRSDVPLDIDGECLHPALSITVNISQTLEYPTNYSNYANNSDCGWLLKTEYVFLHLYINFTFVDIKVNDYVELFDGDDENHTSLGRVSGSILREFHSTGQAVYIKFHSDNSTSGRGFRLTSQTVLIPTDFHSPGVSRPAIFGIVGGSIALFYFVVTVIKKIIRRLTANTPKNTVPTATAKQDNRPT